MEQQQKQTSPAPRDDRRRRTGLLIGAILLVILAVTGIYLLRDREKSSTGADETMDVTDSFDFDALLAQDMPLFLDFGGEDCVPCQRMRPDLIRIHEEYEGRVLVRYVDVWARPEAGRDFPVSAVPTQFFFYADGSPYLPPDDTSLQFTFYERSSTGEHALTAHAGGLNYEQMKNILDDLGA